MAELTNPQNTPEPDGATLTIESDSDLGTLYSYSKAAAFGGDEAANAAEIMANGVGQVPVVGTNTRVVTGQDPLTQHYAGWVQDSEGYGSDLAMEFDVSSKSLTIPSQNGTYDALIDWGDGTVEVFQGVNPTPPSHVYAAGAADIAVVRISGTFPKLFFNNTGDKSKLRELLQLGDTGMTTLQNAFFATTASKAHSGVCNTAAITNMNWTFRASSALVDVDLSTMQTQSATSMAYFLYAVGETTSAQIDPGIESWTITSCADFTSFLAGSKLTTSAYDRTLASWGNQTLAAGASTATIHFGSSTYTDADSKLLLLDQCAGIIDGGYVGDGDDDLIMEFLIDAGDLSLTIPAGDTGSYAAIIDWGDGTESHITTYNDADLTHDYTAAGAGTYTVTIMGQFPHIYFNNGGDVGKLIRILNWGDTSLLSTFGAFYGATNLVEASSEVANTSSVTTMESMMRNWSSMTSPPDLSSFDTSKVTNMSTMMYNWSPITSPPDLSSFDTNSVTNMASMMYNWTSMTSPPDLSSFDTSSVTRMTQMMYNWTSMTSPPDLSSFDTSSATRMSHMMYNWSSMGAIDIPIDTWNIGLVTEFTSFLQGSQLTTACYDRTLIAWAAQDLSGVTTDIHFGNSTYTAGGAAEAARTTIIGMIAGTITDGGAA